MSIKIDDHFLKFPFRLPNDVESFCIFYPAKYPLIISQYEAAAQKLATNSEEFRKYANRMKDELWKGFEKINTDYKNGDQKDLEFLVDIELRLNKLCCFRFWIVNYLFADGPLHDFFVSQLKALIRKFVDATEDIEDYEQKVVLAQRDLLQTEYADLYLQSAIDSIGLEEALNRHPLLSDYIKEVTKLIDQHNMEDTDKINRIWEKVVDIIKDPNCLESQELMKKMEGTFDHARWVGKTVIIYNKLTHSVEFREENRGLEKRYKAMEDRIKTLRNEAKEKLSKEDFELFELCYEQARNFGMYKDIMGAIDPEWLPMWFGIHNQIREIVKKPKNTTLPNGGHAALFYEFMWFLPDHLKGKVLKIDKEDFNLDTI